MLKKSKRVRNGVEEDRRGRGRKERGGKQKGRKAEGG